MASTPPSIFKVSLDIDNTFGSEERFMIEPLVVKDGENKSFKVMTRRVLEDGLLNPHNRQPRSQKVLFQGAKSHTINYINQETSTPSKIREEPDTNNNYDKEFDFVNLKARSFSCIMKYI